MHHITIFLLASFKGRLLAKAATKVHTKTWTSLQGDKKINNCDIFFFLGHQSWDSVGQQGIYQWGMWWAPARLVFFDKASLSLYPWLERWYYPGEQGSQNSTLWPQAYLVCYPHRRWLISFEMASMTSFLKTFLGRFCKTGKAEAGQQGLFLFSCNTPLLASNNHRLETSRFMLRTWLHKCSECMLIAVMTSGPNLSPWMSWHSSVFSTTSAFLRHPGWNSESRATSSSTSQCCCKMKRGILITWEDLHQVRSRSSAAYDGDHIRLVIFSQ